VAAGDMKLGALMAFFVLLTYLYSPIQNIAGVHIEFNSAMASVDRIFEYLDLPPAVVEADAAVRLNQARGSIEIKNLSFGYEENGFRIEDLNLAIPAQTKLAIVGPSGAGKTTLINLIMRFADPESGQITLDGVDLKRLAFYDLRRHISLVEQDPNLFARV
jgi:ABC-type multidrug transport system fused ATPase/permease subunit